MDLYDLDAILSVGYRVNSFLAAGCWRAYVLE